MCDQSEVAELHKALCHALYMIGVREFRVTELEKIINNGDGKFTCLFCQKRFPDEDAVAHMRACEQHPYHALAECLREAVDILNTLNDAHYPGGPTPLSDFIARAKALLDGKVLK